MAKWFQWYAFDVVGELTFSQRFGFFEKEEDVDNSIFQIDRFLYYLTLIGQAFPYHFLLLGNPVIAFLTKNLAGGAIKDVGFPSRCYGTPMLIKEA